MSPYSESINHFSLPEAMTSSLNHLKKNIMNTTLIFLICMLSMISYLLAITHVPKGRRVRQLFNHIGNKLLYQALISRHRLIGPWYLGSTACLIFYFLANILCLVISLSLSNKAGFWKWATTEQMASQSAWLGLINLVPIYSSPSLSFLSDTLGLSLATFRKIHQICGTASLGLLSFHGILKLKDRQEFFSGPYFLLVSELGHETLILVLTFRPSWRS